jgi:RecA-family ATPase
MEQQTSFSPPPDLDLRSIIEADAPPELDFVLPGFLAGTVGALVSPGGAGKSMLALQMAAAIAGADTLKLGVPTGRVQIVALEDPVEPLRARLWDLGSHLSPAMREALYENVHITSLFGVPFDIMDPYCFEWLKGKSQGCRLVTLDTMRRIHSLDENDGGAMALVLSRLETRNASSHLSQCKTFAYGGSLLARREARRRGADDAPPARLAG